MFTTYIGGTKYDVLEPSIYKGNCLYGSFGMSLVDEVPEEHLMSVIRMPLKLKNLSIRRTNRHLIIACLAVVRWDYLKNEVPLITETTLDRIIVTGVKLFEKDLPLRKNALTAMYTTAVIEARIEI